MSRNAGKVYRSYEEFEREELRRSSGLHLSIDEMLDDMFSGELDFDSDGRKRKAGDEDDE